MLSGLNIALLGGVGLLLVLYLLRRRTRLVTTALSTPSGGKSEASAQQEPGV